MSGGDELTSILSNRYFYKKEKNNSYQDFQYSASQLLIIDPLDPTNNVGSGTFALFRVKAAFENSFSILTTTLGSFYCPSLLGRIINIAKSRSRLKYKKTTSTSEEYLGWNTFEFPSQYVTTHYNAIPPPGPLRFENPSPFV